MLDKARYLVIEGPIGCGKTRLAQKLAETLSLQLVREAPERNPFIARFYQHRERWALPLQLDFLFQRLEALSGVTQMLAAGQRVVSDFMLQKDSLFAELNLEADEYALYRRLHERIVPANLPKPDLVIYLQARPETLAERVERRAWAAERGITLDYLTDVCAAYARFFYEYDASPLFILDAEVLDPIHESDDFALVLERLREMRSHREYFGYA